MHLLAQSFPEAMGIKFASYVETQDPTWLEFLAFVTECINDNQPKSAYNMMKQKLHNGTLKQRRGEDIASFKDRFELEITQYNREAKKKAKNTYEGTEMVDLFQSLLLPGYQLYLGEKRLEISERDIPNKDMHDETCFQSMFNIL